MSPSKTGFIFMSSHHIIKEKQEPALIIANGESCSSELLGQLLEWSPFVVVLDGAIDRVLKLEIKVDMLLGDFDSLKLKITNIEKTQFPIEIVEAQDQNKTDLEKAIEYLIDNGHMACNIVWATGRRADHTFANLVNLVKYKNQLKLKIIDDHSVVYPLLPLPSVFKKWYMAGTPISLLPISKVLKLSTHNLKYNLKEEELELGIRIGNSNEVKSDGFVEISYQTGDMLIMECKD